MYGYQGCQGHSDYFLLPHNNRKPFVMLPLEHKRKLILILFLKKLIADSPQQVLTCVANLGKMGFCPNPMLVNSSILKVGVKEKASEPKCIDFYSKVTETERRSLSAKVNLSLGNKQDAQ